MDIQSELIFFIIIIIIIVNVMVHLTHEWKFDTPIALPSHVQYTTYKIIACIERATVLRANIMRVAREYKVGEGVLSSWLTNWCLASPLRVKLFKKPQNSEL